MITLELNFFHNSYRRATCEALILRFVVVGNALCSCLSNLIASYSRVCQIIYPIAIINLHSCPHRKPQSHFVFLLPTHRNINNNSQTQPEQRNFFMPSIYNIISQCLSSSTITLSHARQSHVHILKLGLYGDTYIATKLLSHDANNLYFLQVTNLVLHFFPNPTLPSFTTIINAFARSHQYDAALYLFSLMGHKGLAPDGFLLLTTIKACAALQALIPGLQFHGYDFVSSYALDSILASSLVHMYLKCDSIGDAHRLLDEMSERHVVVWSAIIVGYSQRGMVERAKEMFSEMRIEGVEPNLVSWNGMLAGFSNAGWHVEAVELFKTSNFEVTRKIRILENGVNEKIACGELSAEMFGDIFYWHIPILAMTADVTQASNEECKKCGMAQYLANLISVEGSFSAYSKKLARTIRWTVVELEIQYISF
ncbi:hypothetical protein AHAS_Ahas18G0198700 [Arachis hypogaea]|uniref:Pentatricopeptide repeat-containing protein n=1 Tax=Arachis hypogaea TaxID=3818 RepID=A0A444Y1Y9_ARAHY|nr:hypothetical protein Ahy_B08g091334 [Arachis hypogaea]